MTINHGFTIGTAVIVSKKRADRGGSLGRRKKKRRDGKRGGTDDKWSGRSGGSLRMRKGLNREYQHEPEDKKDAPSTNRGIPFLFVHIPKTGGTSLFSMFRDRCSREEYVGEKWVSEKGTNHRSFHASAQSYIDHFGKKTFDNAFTFAVVRHPLAKQVSNFFFIANSCEKRKRQDCEDRHIPTGINSLSDKEKIEAFHKWIDKLYELYPPGSPDNYLFASKGHGNEDSASFNATQTGWLVDENDKIVVKKIFLLEDLSKDVGMLADAIPCLKNGLSNEVEMVSKNKSPSYPDFMLFAENERTKEIINTMYAVDFDNFGYATL